MNTRTLPELPGCGRAASVRIEVYSPAGGRLHGSLAASVYACDEHGIEAVSALYAAGFTPHRAPMSGPERCGDRQAHGPVTAPAVHPFWCDRQQCQERAEHRSRRHRIAPTGDEITLLEAWLTADILPGLPVTIVVAFTQDGVTQEYPVPAGQARVLVHTVRKLLDLAKRGAR